MTQDVLHSGNEDACAAAVKDFVQHRIQAHEFLPRFVSLWEHWRVDLRRGLDMQSSSDTAFSHVLDAIGHLCETYGRALPPGSGYRVSEEQFRKEVECMASENRRLDAGIH